MITSGFSRCVPLLAILACTPVASEPEPRDVAPVTPPAVAETPAITPEPAPTVLPSRQPEPTTRTLALFPVVRGRSALHLFETTDGTLFVTANAQPIRVTEGGPLVREPRFLDGIADPGQLAMVDWHASMLGGRWPDRMHMVVEADGDRWSARPAVYRFTGNAWSRIANVEGILMWSYRDITPWTDGTMLTLRSHRATHAEEEGDDWSEAQRQKMERALAKAAPREFETLGGSAPNVPSFGEHNVRAFASLPSGDAVTIGDRSMLWWGGDQRKPSKVLLAREPVDEPRLVMRSANDIWMYDGAGLQHFDGTAWSEVETPKDTAVASFAIGTDGKAWLVHGQAYRWSADDNVLFEREDGGAWTQVELPALEFPGDAEPQIDYWGDAHDAEPIDRAALEEKHPLVPIQVVARKDGLWLVARGPEAGDMGDFRWALLHTRDRGAALEVPDPETMRRELIDRLPDVPFTGRKDCDVFVPVAVDDVAGDHQALRAELGKISLPAEGGMALLEVVHDGKPEIGVMIRSYIDKKVAKQVVAALKGPLGTRMGKPICQPMLGKRLIEGWGAS